MIRVGVITRGLATFGQPIKSVNKTFNYKRFKNFYFKIKWKIISNCFKQLQNAGSRYHHVLSATNFSPTFDQCNTNIKIHSNQNVNKFL